MNTRLVQDLERRSRGGFTLVEVMLALGLASLVLMAVGAAIDIHLRVLDQGRAEVEEAQLARTLLGRIADDLRGAVLHDEELLKKFQPDDLPQAGALGSLSGGDESEFDMGDFIAPETDDSDSAASSATSESGDSDDTESLFATPSVPTLYGDRYQLQVDTSRLPRADEYDGILTADGNYSMTDRVSDVRTVSYYVTSDLQANSTLATGTSTDELGLFRREQDRATAFHAAEQGISYDLDEETDAVAPEVGALEFMYFDGSELVDEWDSLERGGLPVAVQIWIGIIPNHLRNDDGEVEYTTTSVDLASGNNGDLLVYSLLVPLPTAQPTSLDDTGTMEDSGDAGSEDSGSSSETSGATPGGSGDSGESSSGASGLGGGMTPGGGGGGTGR